MMFAFTTAPAIDRHIVEAGHVTKGVGSAFVYLVVICLAAWWAARRAHMNHLHWSWAAVVCGGALLLGVLLTGHTVVWVLFGLAGASLLVVHRGRRWRGMLKMRGGEQAKIAHEQRTPLQMLRGLAILFTQGDQGEVECADDDSEDTAPSPPPKWVTRLAKTAAQVLCSLALGITPNADERQIFLGYDDENRRVFIPMKHLFLVGANESGKTTTIRRILKEVAKIQKALGEGIGSVTVDGKGDPDLKQALKLFADMMGVRFWDWSPRGTLKYDFLAHGGNTELVDRALSADTYGDPYFLRLAQRFLGFAVRALVAAGEPPTLKKLAHYIIPSNLEKLGLQMEARKMGSWGEFGETVPDLKGRELEAVHGTHHRLSVLAESDMGPLLEPGGEGESTLNLLEAVRNREIVYFDLHASANRETAKMLGAVIVTDLVTVFATLQYCREFHRCLVILDDVQAYASEACIAGIASLYARARSVGAMMILGTQSFADLKVGHSENLIEAILDNIRTLIVHRLPGAASRKKASEAFGDREEARMTEQVDRRGRAQGEGSVRSERVPYVYPTELKRLDNGCAYIDVTEEDGPRLTQIAMP